MLFFTRLHQPHQHRRFHPGRRSHSSRSDPQQPTRSSPYPKAYVRPRAASSPRPKLATRPRSQDSSSPTTIPTIYPPPLSHRQPPRISLCSTSPGTRTRRSCPNSSPPRRRPSASGHIKHTSPPLSPRSNRRSRPSSTRFSRINLQNRADRLGWCCLRHRRSSSRCHC